MELKKKSLRLGQILWGPFIVFLILPFCGISLANAQTPQQIAKKALAATVLLVMEDANGELLGYGSGFFVDTNLIATNFHVIEGATRGTAKLVGQKTEYTIEAFTAVDEKNDLAILQVSAPGVQPLPLVNSDTVEIGDTVYVAGNPRGYLEGTFSDGIISGVRGNFAEKRLQMTAPISSGSSGGPVLNRTGEVIGVSVMTIEGGQNLNFAIPSNYLRGLVTCTRGIAKFNQEQHTTTIADFDTATRLNPDYADAYMWRGIAKYELGQRAAALGDFDIVIQLKIQKRLQNWKTTRENLGQDAAVITNYDTAIQINPNYAEAYHNRGVAKEKLGQHIAAIKDFDNAIQLTPDHLKAHYYRKHYLNSKFVKKVLAATVRFERSNTSGFFVRTNQIATDRPQQGVVKHAGQGTKYYTIEDTALYSSHNDVAILQVSGSAVQPLPVGDSDMVEVGSRVYIASNPKGSLGGSFVAGNIISVRKNPNRFGVGKEFDIHVDLWSIPRGYPYFSPGGPVLNDKGEVIGIATHRTVIGMIPTTSSKFLKKWLSQ